MEEDGLSSDAVYMESAWEQAAASRGRANGGSDVPRVSPPETLDLRVFCGTWNVAGRMLEDGDDTTIAEWLDLDVNFSQDSQDEDKPEPPDIFVIGLQEVVDLSAHNVVMDSLLDTQSRSNTLKWFTAIYAFLTQYGQRYGLRYVMLAEQRLLGTYILVMASTVVCPKLGQVQSTAIPTGLGGWLGNKGAVAVHVDVGGSASLCFVCVHMASHRENLEVRNAEYKQIVSRPVFFEAAGGGRITRHASFGSPTRERRQSGWGTLFAGGVSQANANAAGLSPTRAAEMKKALKAVLALGPKAGEARVRSGTPSGQGPQAAEGISRHSNTISGDSFHRVSDGGSTHGAGVDYLPKTKTVLQADIVFWIGDLNYRIVEDVPDSKVFEMLERDDLEKLRALDQLNVERAARRAFGEFQEGPLCFVPSYKYIPGTRKYDQRPEKKARCPSWCDRVLYSVGNYGGNSVRRLALDNYWSEGPLFSDHMPVNALFRTSIRCAAEEAISEREIEAEPISPRRAQAAAAFVSAPFARIEVDPATLVLTLRKGVKWLIAVIVVSNTGGVRGSFHLTGESRPAWLKWEGTGRGSLSPGERAELRLSIDVEAAEEVASRSSAGVAESAEARDATLSACAVLRIEADGGGSGVLLPVTCTFAEI